DMALQLQPDSGEAHLALANYHYFGFRDYARARSELALALRSLPNNADIFVYTGFINRREGKWQEATLNLERALELDPRNPFILQQLAIFTYQPQRRYAEEEKIFHRALEIVPDKTLTRANQAQLLLHWRADVKGYQSILAAILAEDLTVAPDVD